MGNQLHKTAHFRHRSATRGFRDEYTDLLEAYGDYVDQKGGSYALLIDEAKAYELKKEFAQELQQMMHEMKLRRLRIKKLGLSAVRSPAEIIESDEEEKERIMEIRKLERRLRAIKPGFAVFGRKSETEGLRAITVAPITKKLKGFKNIYE